MSKFVHLLGIGLVVLILFPFVYAQTLPLQQILDAITNLQNQINTIISSGLQFAQETDARLNALQEQVSGISEIGSQLYLDQNQQINVLQQNQIQLQQQISALQNQSFVIDRNKIYEVINSNSNENIAYCNDANDILLFGYCLGSLTGLLIDQNNGMHDNFNDGEYQNNPTWVVLSGGGFYANTFELSHASGSAGQQSIITSFNPDYNAIKWVFRFKIKTSGFDSANGTGFSLGNQQVTPYWIYWSSNGANAGKFVFQQIGGIAIIESVNQFMALNTYYDVELKKDGNLFELKVNDIPEGSTYYPDLTPISHITWVANWGLGSGGIIEAVDDINFSTYSQDPSNTAIKNLNELNSPIGFSCRFNGTARVMCLQQD